MQSEKIGYLLKHGNNAKEEISKLRVMIDDMSSNSRRDGSILYSEQHTTTIGSNNDRSILQSRMYSHSNAKANERNKKIMKLGKQEDI